MLRAAFCSEQVLLLAWPAPFHSRLNISPEADHYRKAAMSSFSGNLAPLEAKDQDDGVSCIRHRF